MGPQFCITAYPAMQFTTLYKNNCATVKAGIAFYSLILISYVIIIKFISLQINLQH